MYYYYLVLSSDYYVIAYPFLYHLHTRTPPDQLSTNWQLKSLIETIQAPGLVVIKYKCDDAIPGTSEGESIQTRQSQAAAPVVRPPTEHAQLEQFQRMLSVGWHKFCSFQAFSWIAFLGLTFSCNTFGLLMLPLLIILYMLFYAENTILQTELLLVFGYKGFFVLVGIMCLVSRCMIDDEVFSFINDVFINFVCYRCIQLIG